MQGGIAQTIGLVLAANARMRGLSAARWPDGSIYTFCNRVRFEGRKNGRLFGLGRSVAVDDPNQWLETLPAGMEKAQLTVLPRNDPKIPDRESVGFAGGGPVFLAQIVASRVESWHGDWRVTRDHAEDRRIWSVTYRNLAGVPTEAPALTEDNIRNRLSGVLEEALRFSTAHNMGFLDMFGAAQSALDHADPLAGHYHADMIPDGLIPLKHRQIFGCAAKAWVFGGMGSWNDVWFEGDEQIQYRTLSDALFSAIIDGLVLATNASAANR